MSTPRSARSGSDLLVDGSRRAGTAGDRDFAAAVAHYLTLAPRQLPSRYLYDALGSALFDAICELPWYTITRAERTLLDRHGEAIWRLCAPLSRIVELGPGDGSKLLSLLQSRDERDESGDTASGSTSRRLEVHLIDVSSNALARAERALDSVEDVSILKHEATYERGLSEVARGQRPAGRTLALFLGSNIGNFDPPASETFLRAIRCAMRPGDALLMGVDLVKPMADLLLAYDDPLGVTAAFNRNLLVRLHRELGADVDVDAFDHRAVWNGTASRIEMHLVSRRRQCVRIPDASVDIELEAGEIIWTESSYKYEPREVTALLSRAGFEPKGEWLAVAHRFALFLAEAATF